MVSQCSEEPRTAPASASEPGVLEELFDLRCAALRLFGQSLLAQAYQQKTLIGVFVVLTEEWLERRLTLEHVHEQTAVTVRRLEQRHGDHDGAPALDLALCVRWTGGGDAAGRLLARGAAEHLLESPLLHEQGRQCYPEQRARWLVEATAEGVVDVVDLVLLPERQCGGYR